MTAPKIYQFISAITYLTSIYSFRKQENTGFTYESWAAELGFKSRSFLKMIISNERNITPHFINVFSESMGFDLQEKNYFSLIAGFDRCENEEEQKYYLDRIHQIQGQQKNLPVLEDYEEFLSSKTLPILLLSLSFKDIDRSPDGISKLLQISKQEALDQLQFLEKMNLAKCEQGQWGSTNSSFKVPKKMGCEALKTYHNNSLLQAIAAQELPSDQRTFRSSLVPLSKEDYLTLLQDIEALIHRTLAKYDTDLLTDKQIYRLNINLTPALPKTDENKPENTTRLLEI